MKIVILGCAGYIGIPLFDYLRKSYKVFGCDNFWRSKNATSLTPVKSQGLTILDITNYKSLKRWIKNISPDVIIHLAEQPSAPYSMKGPEEAAFTQHNNIVGSLNVLWAIREVNPDIHLIKLGTAGEYPDWLYPPEVTIPESPRINVQYNGVAAWSIPTPRYGGSWYHMSKLHDSFNCDYANRIWGLTITDINQAPVYGYIEGTRFDYDECFGTVVNRFIVQALAGYPLTVYGEGGQTRGFIHIRNSLEAIKLIIENRPEGFQTVHQLTETKTISEIAQSISNMTGAKIQYIENPRAEKASNQFNFECKILKSLGLDEIKMEDSLGEFIEKIRPYKSNINSNFFAPQICW